MPQLTTVARVQNILAQNYDWINTPDLQVHIDAAVSLVDQTVSWARRVKRAIPGGGGLGSQQELMQAYMAAQCYCSSDPLYLSKSTAGASATFMREGDKDYGEFGAKAVRIDPSGCLGAIIKRAFAESIWLGKSSDDQDQAMTQEVTFDSQDDTAGGVG